MFSGLRKKLTNKIISDMKNDAEELKSKAKFYQESRYATEDKCIKSLRDIALKNGTTIAEAANTEEARSLVAEVLLNKQFALYYVESYIQKVIEIRSISDDRTKPSTDCSNYEWYEHFVSGISGAIAKRDYNKEVDRMVTLAESDKFYLDVED